MDEPTNVPVEPVAPAPKSTMPKVLLTLFLLSLALGLGAAYGVKYFVAVMERMATFSQKPEKIQAWVTEAKLPGLSFPDGCSFQGAYRNVLNNKDLWMFVATTKTSGAALPKKSAAGFDINLFPEPVYFVFVNESVGAKAVVPFDLIVQNLRLQGNVVELQPAIWVSEKPVPVFMAEIEKAGTTRTVLAVAFDENKLLLASRLKDNQNTEANTPLLASAFKTSSDTISFFPPDPLDMKLAKKILNGDIMERKQAVTALATADVAKSSAVAYLGLALSSAPADVKIDVVAALGLVAKSNPEAIPYLVSALNDQAARMEAMVALGSLGSLATAAAEPLKKIALDKKEPKAVQKAALTAYAQIEGRPLLMPKKTKKGKPAPKKKG